jgi:hypothetical protein
MATRWCVGAVPARQSASPRRGKACTCNHWPMRPDDESHESFEDMVRSIAEEISRSVEARMADMDVEGFVGGFGVNPDAARQWVESAGRWLRGQAENLGDEMASRSAGSRGPAVDEDPLRRAGPHPLDLPTGDQGLALAALDSGRWTVEPGSNALVAHGEGPGPTDALGLVRELHARDWITVDGEVTLAGGHALSRWLDAAQAR